MKIDKQKLYELYMQDVEEICEFCDWKTSFTAQECVEMVANILEQHPELISND